MLGTLVVNTVVVLVAGCPGCCTIGMIVDDCRLSGDRLFQGPRCAIVSIVKLSPVCCEIVNSLQWE